MKSNVSGRVVPQPESSGCRPQNVFYNPLGVHHHNQQQQQQQHHHHQQQQHQSLAYHPHHQTPQQHQNYAMLQCFSQHTSSGWAGIPLISTAASSNRRQRKPSVSTHRPPPAVSCNPLHMYNSTRDPHSNEYSLNPMTRLAMHAQGAPLLLTGSYNRNRLNGNGGGGSGSGSSNRQMRPLNPNSSEGYTCKPNGQLSLHQKAKENNNSGPGGGANVQSEAAAACLPRIIKPRKRRKKDRKPLPPTNFIKMDNEPDATAVSMRGPTKFDRQQHYPQMLSFENETQCNLKRAEPSIDLQQDPATGFICFCRQCDPLSRIWAFPLRRSHSDNSSDTTEFESSNKNVGVIGSNRSSQLNLIKNTHTGGSLSDSSDSGYGDILSGIHIGDDFFTNNYLQLQKLPTDLLLSPTAESLLTESINEISRKLMETCDIKGAGGGSSSPSSSSSSSDSCSVFSDSGLSSATSSNHPSGDELIFNFENLSINSTDHSTNLLFPTNDSIFDCFSADINNNNITSTPGDGDGSLRIDPQLFNCLDLLWGTQPPSHPDQPKQSTSSPSSSSSTSSSSFYRPTVASM